MIPFKDDVPTRTRPVVTVGLIVLNSLVFLFQQSLPQGMQKEVVYLFGAIPARVSQLPVWFSTDIHNPLISVVSSMFLHGGWLHLLGNMLYLWIFGNNVEDSMGHIRFIFFYLISGFAAAGAQVISAPDSTVPMIGASGAISGVLGAYLILHPFARVHTLVIIIFFIRVIPLPAIFVLGFWFFIQIANGLIAPPGAAGVAWMAHIGGFIAGIVLIRFFQKGTRRRQTVYW
ncbi:MAG TPA: rhomboid family intramembrane serine protease [archaeon]|nr:rhomboid family intramembrane serine protease [archaeon]